MICHTMCNMYINYQSLLKGLYTNTDFNVNINKNLLTILVNYTIINGIKDFP